MVGKLVARKGRLVDVLDPVGNSRRTSQLVVTACARALPIPGSVIAEMAARQPDLCTGG